MPNDVIHEDAEDRRVNHEIVERRHCIAAEPSVNRIRRVDSIAVWMSLTVIPARLRMALMLRPVAAILIVGMKMHSFPEHRDEKPPAA